ncbi:MAG: Ca2+:H+ antiporter [Actinomycetes bacterium]
MFAVVVLAFTWGSDPAGQLTWVLVVALVGAILAAVHHAEVVALKVGEPFGSLVLAVAVTVIEVGLIVTLMISGGDDKSTLARDTVFAALMITANGIVGISLIAATFRGRVALFNPGGSGGALGTVAALAALCLVLPTFTVSSAGATFTGSQLAFAAVASVVLYGLYVFVATVRHRDFFLPEPIENPTTTQLADAAAEEERHAVPPTNAATATSLSMLVVGLVAVVGLAKTVSPAIESAIAGAGLPITVVAIVIALVVLLPEALAAGRAAARGRIQTSFNLAYGSALASIGLTIPAIAIASIWIDGPLVLGLGAIEMVLLTLTVALGILTLNNGRATVLQGGVHLVVFAGFLMVAVLP